MARFCAVAEKYSDGADFLVVYIEEAHPSAYDLPHNEYKIKQHSNVDDRIASAQFMVDELEGQVRFPVVVDGFDNNAMYAYGARPERFYIIQDGRVVFQGRRGPLQSDVGEVEKFLERELLKKD